MDGIAFDQIVKRGCGIDIHRDEAVATIGGEGITTETRSFKTFTSSLTELKEWLIENGVTDVAMEFVGTKYQDYFRIIVNDGNSNEVLFSKAIDSFAEEFSLSPVSPTIEFDQGDVYMTRWMNTKFDIRKYQGKTITLISMSGDIGDSIYDSAVLLDEITVN